MAKFKIPEWLVQLGRVHSVWALLKVYVIPYLPAVLAVIFGLAEGQPLMWIVMAGALTFGGTALGILMFSEYRERKNPAHKLVYVVTRFSCELLPAPMPLQGNRGQRRTQSRIGQEPRILGPNELSPQVSRKLKNGQIGVAVKNNASFPISCLLFSATTKIEDETPPRTTFPKAPKLLGPGEVVTISDEPIDLDEMPCARMAGEMEMKIRYGSPGNEIHELHLRANLSIEMEHFGFVTSVNTGWLA